MANSAFYGDESKKRTLAASLLDTPGQLRWPVFEIAPHERGYPSAQTSNTGVLTAIEKFFWRAAAREIIVLRFKGKDPSGRNLTVNSEPDMNTPCDKKRLPANPKTLRSMGRRIAPILARALTRQPWLNYLRWSETYLALLQGKGAGDGWDLKAEVEAAAKFVPGNKPVVFDVGANIGNWSKLFLDQRPYAKLFLFEPASACQAAIAGLHLSNARLIGAAVGRTKGTAQLHTCDPTAEIASLYARRNSPELKFSSMEVPVVRLDDVIEELQIETVDFPKMDIEGAEIDALHGAMVSLRAGTIRALSFEFGLNNIESRTFFRDFWDLLIPFGFSIFRIAPGGNLIQIHEYREELEYFKIVSNYVAVIQRPSGVGRQSE